MFKIVNTSMTLEMEEHEMEEHCDLSR